jgi:hypothetical protein
VLGPLPIEQGEQRRQPEALPAIAYDIQRARVIQRAPVFAPGHPIFRPRDPKHRKSRNCITGWGLPALHNSFKWLSRRSHSLAQDTIAHFAGSTWQSAKRTTIAKSVCCLAVCGKHKAACRIL